MKLFIEEPLQTKESIIKNKGAMDFIKEQQPSCYGDIELLMKDYAKHIASTLVIKCAKCCDQSSHPQLAMFQINIDKLLL